MLQTRTAIAGTLPVRPNPDVETTAFRLVQEVTTSAVAHPCTRSSTIRLSPGATDFLLEGDGEGIRSRELAVPAGLTALREPVRLLGGSATVDVSTELHVVGRFPYAVVGS